uniref:PiggyBac transposable element-derived protein domain-containing protein n=1 Tax=Octopus bimaculoides TaxID=37653 RepID=A0A0L8IF49_OCTBM
MVRESVRYATECKNRPTTIISSDDIKLFIGVLLISGYHKFPAETQYWSNDEDLDLQIVKNAMSRSRFQEMKSILHFCDINEAENNKNDRGFKVRKLIAAAQKSFMKFGIFEEHLAVDEMIVKCYGHHTLKQFIRSKPIRFGYKFWAICGVSGYCYNFDLYCGKSSSDDNRVDLLLGSKVILNMLDVVEEPQSYSVFFDNLFTGYELLVHLRELGFQATGTVRENRLKKCTLMEAKELKKQNRGTYSFRFDTNEEIIFVKWLDNTCITIGTNYDTVEPLQKVQRWLKECKAKCSVSQPHVFKNYSAYMGGVDKHDWWIRKYASASGGMINSICRFYLFLFHNFFQCGQNLFHS